MSISGTVRVACPACKQSQEAKLVQSINARTDKQAYTQLLGGELNLLVCSACGKRTQLVAKVVFVDPDRDYFAQVVPGGPDALAEAKLAFDAAGAIGTLRVVPSQNALVEKLKLLEAGLEDWAIEMTKVLLLAADTDALEAILLFDGVDRDAGVIQWLRYDEEGPRRVASALAAYEKLAAREASRPDRGELQIDRLWAVEAVQSMIANAN